MSLTESERLREKARGFSRRDDWSAARHFFEAEVLRVPRGAEVHAHLGYFCMKESRYDTSRSLTEYSAALALDAGCALAHVYRAVTLASLQRPAQAREALLAAERLGAAPEDLIWARGSVELDAGSAAEAVSRFGLLVEREKDSTSMILLSQAHSQAGDNAAALAWAKKAAAADPGDFRAPTYAGIYLAYLKRFAEARAELEKALLGGAQYPLLRHALAYVAREEGKPAEEERRLRETLALDPEYVTSRKRLADVCAATGRVQEAREHYHRALERFPDYEEARESLDRLDR